MRIFNLFLLLMLSSGLFAGSAPKSGTPPGKYQEAMQKYIHLIDTANTVPSFLEAANFFERIAKAEPTEWLPEYYAAYSYLNAAMTTDDLDVVDDYCDKAEGLLAGSGSVEGADQSEILCLFSLAYTVRIKVDMFGRGMQNTDISMKLLKEAAELNPANPRVYYLRARLIVGRPKQFGGGLEAGLPLLQVASQHYAKVPHVDGSLLPDWGRKITASLLARAKK